MKLSRRGLLTGVLAQAIVRVFGKPEPTDAELLSRLKTHYPAPSIALWGHITINESYGTATVLQEYS